MQYNWEDIRTMPREQASYHEKSAANLYNMIHMRRDALQFRQPAVNTESR